MNSTLTRFIFAIALLALPIRTASAADIQTCKDFAKFASQNATEIRALGGCFLNLSDITLSTDYSRQFRWCIGVEDTQVITSLVKNLTTQTNKCKRCKDYARIVTAAAQANIQNHCGFTSSIDNRWKPDYNYHMKGCMEARYEPESWGPSPYEYVVELDAIAGDMLLQIERCKKTHPIAVCKTCHTQTSTALLPAALRPPPKRGRSGHDFSVARQPPAFKPEGTSSGGSDEAKPSGERRRSPGSNRGTSSGDSNQAARGAPNPCGSGLKPCKPQRVLGPGLLEGGGGALGTQGPAATGSPMQTAPTQWQRGGGGGGTGVR